ADENISRLRTRIKELEERLQAAESRPPRSPVRDTREIEALNKKVEDLEMRLEESNRTISQMEAHRRESQSGIDYNLRDKLDVCQLVTSFSIVGVEIEDEGTSYHCKQTGPNGEFCYTLTVFDDNPDQFQYTPNLEKLGSQPLAKVLPEYLRTALEFRRDLANMFFWRVCDFLHSTTTTTTT
ncbi:hypothetical protein EV182_007790, partial [Spiromyces aspiralis]